MKESDYLREAFMNAVINLADENSPEKPLHFREHDQLMAEDSRYNAAFRKYQELANSEEVAALSRRINGILSDTWGRAGSQKFLVTIEALKHLPLIFKMKRCEKKIMDAFDRKFGPGMF